MELGRRTSRRWLAFLAAAALVAAMLPLLSGALASAATKCTANTGENGATWVDGTSGNDRCIAGGNGPDVLKGKGGKDRIVGGRGPDKLRGGPGNDLLRGGQGPDTFYCGPGQDIVVNNRSTGADYIDASCETVR